MTQINGGNITLQSVARALGGEISGNQVQAPGPGHSAKDRSLSVKLDAGAPDGFVVHSFADDDPIACKDYVRQKIGAPAFQPNGGRRQRASAIEIGAILANAMESVVRDPPKGRVTTVYPYTDAAGKLLYDVVRYEPKDFRQRRPDGKGGWIWSVKDCPRVLYRLPELLKYPDATVFVCEGEKDSDRVASLGHCATTVACGTWTDDCVMALAGRDVVILEDADKAGHTKALKAARVLHGTAKTIRIVLLPGLTGETQNKDVSDWLDADPRAHTAEKLVAVCLEAPLWTPGASDAMEENKADAAVVDHGGDPGDAEERAAAEKPTIARRQAEAESNWPVMDKAAYHGLAGDVVRTIVPHTEADPVAILIQYASHFGNIIGNAPHYLVESDRHSANLFAVLVGASSKGRKGTAAGRVRAVAKLADETWATERTASGLSSGEGLINAVRNPVKKWNAKDKIEEVVDPGVSDKRLMVTEPEFAGALAVMERHGNTLSPVIRNAWDGHRLQTLTKNSPLKADGAHISIVAHITETEARARLTRTDMANGFANRFQFFCVRRSQFLPHGGDLDEAELAKLGERTKEAVQFARATGRVVMTPEARAAWQAAYRELSAERPGLLGAVIARAEAQVIRLAVIYALLDQSNNIDVAHLEAAMAVWAYAEESAVRIFGDSLGDPVADEILVALRRSSSGMTRSDIHALFGRHQPAEQVSAALTLLLKAGRVKFETKHTGGRPVETWSAI
jgi:hypothetical protein